MLDESNRQHKIRRVGTDARERKQPFSSLSRQNLWDMVFGKTDIVEWYKRNRYKHVLGKVLLDGRDINLEQIMVGLAWHYKQYGKAQPFVDRSTMRG